MQTNFTLAQLADPDVAEANQILRACVHCGFCTATCPTYVLLGDELDSPRGRIYLIKGMLENEEPASAKVVKHIDRCLSCLACMTTCPSGVHYMHLVDHARRHIEETYTRPLGDRLLRDLVAWVVPSPTRFRWALTGAWLARPFAKALPRRLRAMVALAPAALPSPSPVDRPQVFPAEGPPRARPVAPGDRGPPGPASGGRSGSRSSGPRARGRSGPRILPPAPARNRSPRLQPAGQRPPRDRRRPARVPAAGAGLPSPPNRAPSRP